jgi:osmotically-inducible protein OsmY
MGQRYSQSNYGYGQDMNRSNEDRGLWQRTRDEVSSWFGDEDAERRRERDRMLGGDQYRNMSGSSSMGSGYGSSRGNFGSDIGRNSNRGKGPKSYRRSDERIKEDISDRLADDERVDASEIDVTVTNCEVTLTGTVDSREEKRRAEDLVEQVSGVQHVQNNIRVQREGASQDRTSGNYGSSSGSSFGSTSGSSGSNLSQRGSTGMPGSTGASPGSSQSESSSGQTARDKDKK